MATVSISSGGSATLGTAQTGNTDSTNTIDRGFGRGAGAIVVTSTIGATPTVKLDIQGSVDGVNFYNVGYSLVATPETVAVAQITITTAVSTTYLLRADHAWRFLKCVYSVNTNVTLTATAYL